ncbi:hypothetical protein RQP46_003563 [Phenoliferia psychrophenolica]
MERVDLDGQHLFVVGAPRSSIRSVVLDECAGFADLFLLHIHDYHNYCLSPLQSFVIRHPGTPAKSGITAAALALGVHRRSSGDLFLQIHLSNTNHSIAADELYTNAWLVDPNRPRRITLHINGLRGQVRIPELVKLFNWVGTAGLQETLDSIVLFLSPSSFPSLTHLHISGLFNTASVNAVANMS